MAADLERLAREFRGNKFKNLRNSLLAQAQIARQLGAPEHFNIPAAQLTTKETTPVEARRFSDEARAALESAKEGYRIVTLTGQSIACLRAGDRKFWSDWHNKYPEFEALISMQSEVAIKPDQLFIPESNNKTLAQQEEMINKFSQELGKRIPGVDAIMGSAPDYSDLAFAYLDKHGEYLFGKKYGYSYARTNTPTVGTHVALVGHFDRAHGLHVAYWYRDRGSGNMLAAPLVVPGAK
jgi:hypothetical protein